MAMILAVLAHFRTSLRFLVPFTAILLAVRLLIIAVALPIIGLIIRLVLSHSERIAITDQEIARFLLTPLGLGAALVVASLLIATAMLNLTMMSLVLSRKQHNPAAAIHEGFSFVAMHLPRLLLFGLHLFLRILSITAPFLAAMAAVAIVLLGSYDINFYLTARPSSFWAACAMIGILAIVLAVVLLSRLSGWAMALHIVLIERMPPGRSFKDSRRLLEGEISALAAKLLVWAILRGILAMGLAGIMGFAIAHLSDAFGTNLRLVAAMTMMILIAWSLGSAVVTAVAQGALADMLLQKYARVTGNVFTADATASKSTWFRIPAWGVALGALALAGTGIFLGHVLLSRVGQERAVEIIAHRGAAGSRPENTMAAVTKAIEDRADWVEIDVQEDADGEVVVAHDSDFMKLAGVDLKVWEATADDIARIDIGSWFGPEYQDQRTPFLKDVLLAARGKSKVIIELKYYGHDVDLERKVAEIVEEAMMSKDVAVMSLKYPGLQKMQSIRPELRSGVLAAKAIGDLSGLEADFLAVNTGQVSSRMIANAKSVGKDVYVWTVDDPVTMSRMISMGVDGLITNEPALARDVMQRRNEMSTGERLLLWLADRFEISNYQLVADPKDA